MFMHPPLPYISIVVPVYNTSPYLKECLDSATNQTLKDIEIICINDGSTDNSYEILKQYANQDSRITVIDQQNSGVSVARNTGILNANGEYVLFLDSDDILCLDTCETIYNMAKQNNSDMICFCKKNLYDNDKSAVPLKYTENVTQPEIATSDNTDFCKLWFEKGNASVIQKLYKLSFLKSNNLLFAPGLVRSEDKLFNFIAFPYASTISFTRTIALNYRIRDNSACHCKDTNYKVLHAHTLASELAFRSCKERSIYKGYEQEVFSKFCNLEEIAQLANLKEKSLASKRIIEAAKSLNPNILEESTDFNFNVYYLAKLAQLYDKYN